MESDHPELRELYTGAWGAPEDDLPLRHAESGRRFHVLTFPVVGAVVKIATAGLGSCPADDHAPLGVELLLVLPNDFGGAGRDRAARYMADIGAHLLRRAGRPTEGSVIPHSSISPWVPDAVVFDAPRGEPERFERFVADGFPLRLVWLVPVHAAEAALVVRAGVEAFDDLVDKSDFSLVDVRRPSLVEVPGND